LESGDDSTQKNNEYDEVRAHREACGTPRGAAWLEMRGAVIVMATSPERQLAAKLFACFER
jgi:hypothetical protein